MLRRGAPGGPVHLFSSFGLFITETVTRMAPSTHSVIFIELPPLFYFSGFEKLETISFADIKRFKPQLTERKVKFLNVGQETKKPRVK